MTCRLELEFNHQSYPRSCPTCGLAGKCQKGYQQLKRDTGGYCIVNAQGNSFEVPGPKRDDHAEVHHPTSQPGFTSKLTRVKRARIADLIENEWPTKIDERDLMRLVNLICLIVEAD